MKKVCVVYNIPHHYRTGIWRELSMSKRGVFEICYGYDEGRSDLFTLTLF